MLAIPTYLRESPLHGWGCFTTYPLIVNQLVWFFQPEVDRILDPDFVDLWERAHAYGSNASGRLVLPGDNAAWINFHEQANLIEAEEINREFCLRAARNFRGDVELTVPFSSDTDVEWKRECMRDATS